MKATFQCFVGKKHCYTHMQVRPYFSQLLPKLCFMILELSYVYLKVIFGLQWTLYVVIHNFPKNIVLGVSPVGRRPIVNF